MRHLFNIWNLGFNLSSVPFIYMSKINLKTGGLSLDLQGQIELYLQKLECVLINLISQTSSKSGDLELQCQFGLQTFKLLLKIFKNLLA